jgi:hypothetical protein
MPNWNDLPQEMKDEVLKYHVTVAAPITGMTNPSHVTRVLIRLARTNKKMYDNAVKPYCSRNTFVIGKTLSARGLGVWAYPKPEVAKYIKNLVVKIRVQTLPQPYDLEASMRGYDDLRFLLRPDDQTAARITARKYSRLSNFESPWENHVDWTPDAVKWQRSIQKVDNLKVVLIFGEVGLGNCSSSFSKGLDCLPWYCSAAAPTKPRDRFVQMVRTACIDVQAKEVEVVVEGLRCTCDGTCAEVYVSTIKAMIKAPEEGEEGSAALAPAQKEDYEGVFVVSALDANPKKVLSSPGVVGKKKRRIARVGRKWKADGVEPSRRSERIKELEMRKRKRAEEEQEVVEGGVAKKMKR